MTKPPIWFTQGWPHSWLPYAQMQTAPLPLPVAGAKGCRITLSNGKELIDGIASWWSMCHGYQHPRIVEAICKQAETLSHIMFGGLAHEPAYSLAARLIQKAPDGLNRVFFSDSGSTAVEVALKMALQYFSNQGKLKKTKFVCLAGSYHGDTMGAMAVSDRAGLHAAFKDLTTKHFSLEIPSDEYSFAEFEETLAEIAPTVAALIIEPLVQGAGGMKFHSPDVLAEIRRVCREHDILFIADEIMTGFYRTGTFFACDEAAICPDIMCVGKALTGGHIPLAATLATEAVYEGFLSDEWEKAFMHGPTYMANPLACAAANASLALFEQVDYGRKVERIESQLHALLKPCEQLPQVVDVRVRGAIGVVQVKASPDTLRALRPRAIEQGVWLRPFGDIIYTAPPLTISDEELGRIGHCISALAGGL